MSLESYQLVNFFFYKLNFQSGLIHWTFETERYFGPQYRDVKDTMRVTVLPPEPLAAEPAQKLKYAVF